MKNKRFYQEIRGVMTRFEPLTEQALEAAGKQAFTLPELHQALREHGLDPRHVVHDPGRTVFSTYYADYDKGLYSDILLQRSSLEEHAPLFRLVRSLNGQAPMELTRGDWGSYYMKYVPLAMLIYDFQRRLRDIPTEEVFSVWHGIYKRIDFSNDMWTPEVLEYVFSHAPKPQLPETGSDGRITIYRGMGDLSLVPEQAISWSTHPVNAIWFANHSGCGTRFAVGRILPEQVVAHYPSFSCENEVIVRPGAVTDYYYENMIPATKSRIISLLAPALPDYIRFGRQALKLGYQEEGLLRVHGLKHILRVLLLSLIYLYHSGDMLSDGDKHLLIYFSLLHDIGRDNDEKDDSHGDKSAALIQAASIRINGLRLTRKGYRIAELMIRHHCRDDDIGEAAIQAAPGLSRKEKLHVIHLYRICKDMDGLDRVRFNGLDYRQLRTEYGRQLPLVAGCLLQENLIQALHMEDPPIEGSTQHNTHTSNRLEQFR